MVKVRKILGGLEIEGVAYHIGKLDNEKYAVGRLVEGGRVHAECQFDSIDAAFDYWLETFPVPRLQRRN